jgi:hypothetical protein
MKKGMTINEDMRITCRLRKDLNWMLSADNTMLYDNHGISYFVLLENFTHSVNAT